MLVLSARVVLHAVVIQFPWPVFCSRRYSLQIVTALRHSTSVTRMMCSLNRVVSAGDKVLVPSVSARGALRFQRWRVFGLIPSNIPGQSRCTSHKHRCMSHRRSLLHWSSMSRNQSRAMGSTWTLRRLEALPLGSSSTSAAAGVAGAAVAARECELLVSKLVVVEDVVLKSAFPELMPGGPTARLLRVPVWWPTQTNRHGDGGPQARTSSREEESRSPDDEERLLTKRFIEWHRANNCETLCEVKRLKTKSVTGQDRDLTVFPGNKPVAHVPKCFSASQ